MKPTEKYTAKDVMSSDLVTVSPHMTCKELEELFISEKISGAPVVNEIGELQGVISVYDVLESEYHHNFFSDSYQEFNYGDGNTPLEHLYEDRVEDYMSRKAHTAYPETPVKELAQQMYNNKIHRVIILDPLTEKPVGIVSTFDLLKLQTNSINKMAKAS